MKYLLIAVLIVIVIILAFFILRILPLLIAKPTIKIDYVTEYNKITLPANYTPADNAAPYYQKAFDAIVEIPEALKGNINTWPGDMNESQFNTMKTWLESNSQALDYLSQAVKKPYCWYERHGTDNAIFNIQLPEVSKFRNGAWALNMQAKLNAYQGQYELAFNQIIELHQMGLHCSGPVTLMEQVVGLAVRGIAFNTAFSVIDKTDVNTDLLTDFQTRFEQQIQKSIPLNFTIGEKIYSLDMAQRMFTDNGKDDGFLIPAKLFTLKKDSWVTPPISFVRAVLICLNHPGRKDTITQFQKLYEELDKIIYKTPWQLRQDGTSYQNYFLSLTKDNYFLNDGASALGRICELSWRQKISGDALVTSLALLRYKADKGSFPASLQELILSNYVEKLPMDPYSDNPLIYKKTDGDFELYSVGADFEDNGGKPVDWNETEQGGDRVFWPLP